VLLVLGLLMPLGCSSRPTDAQRLAASELTAATPPPPEWLEHPTTELIDGDPARAMDDIARAVRRLNWAVVSSHTVDAQDLDRQMSASHLHAVTALLPDGREAKVYLSIERRAIGVRAQVGRFGDEALELKLIETYLDLLRGPPMKKRNKNFELPEGMFEFRQK